MAQQEISETGEPERIKIEDTPPPVRKAKTAHPYSVIICDACGKGYLRWVGDGVDIEPVWDVPSARIHGGICGGALVMKNRPAAIEIADNFEKIGASAWLKGQRRP
jgi:hypothetical protein